jgi:hypothetical protein
VKYEYLVDELTFLPKAEGIAVGEEDVGKRVKLFALSLVVRVDKSAWVGTLARGLEFDKTSESVVDCNGVRRTKG